MPGNIEIFHKNAQNEFKKIGVVAKFEVVKFVKFKPDVVFVFSIFRLSDPYKKDENYKKGMEWILDNFHKTFTNFVIRIYIDDSFFVKDETWCDLYEKLLAHKSTEIIKYDFPIFKNGKYHKDLFGTLIRILPIFDFYNIQETTINVDVDIMDYINPYSYIHGFKSYIKIAKKHNGLLLRTYDLHKFMDSRLYFSDILQKYDFIIRFIMQTITCSKKLDKQIFLNFIKCMTDKCAPNINWYSTIFDELDCAQPLNKEKDYVSYYYCARKEAYLNTSHSSEFFYGVDEFFLNSYVLDALLKNKMPFIIHLTLPNYDDYHYFLFNRLFIHNKITYQYMRDFYNFVFAEDNRNRRIEDDFKRLDKMIYKKNEKNAQGYPGAELVKTVKDRIYIFINDSFNNNISRNLTNLDKNKIKAVEIYFSLISKKNLGEPPGFYKVEYAAINKHNLRPITS